MGTLEPKLFFKEIKNKLKIKITCTSAEKIFTSGNPKINK